MDADMQHDEKLLPRMPRILKSEPVDLVLGSRYVAGGGIGEWASRVRIIKCLRRWRVPDHLPSRHRRSDERVFHAAAGGAGRSSAAPLRPRIQDPPRHPSVVAATVAG
jgi:hypothetical protein